MVKPISVYLPDELYVAVRDWASFNRRSLSAEIVYQLDARHRAEVIPVAVASKKPAARTGRAERATRVPADFLPTEDMKQWAREHTPNIGWDEHDRFMDYWKGVPGARGEKLSWEATWRNWMRKAQDQAPGSRPVKSRHQQETDEWFDRAMARARQKDEARELAGNDGPGPLAPLGLPGPAH